MNRAEAAQQYLSALKAGKKQYHDAVKTGKNPYPLVLDVIVDEAEIAGREDLGVVNIPSSLIVGTKTAGRMAALSANFMPLLEEESEFASKWISLCAAHLSDEGIRDPIVCLEYLGRFFVIEGNKRVSVLKSFSAPTVPGRVTRLVPKRRETVKIKVYYEFMQFYAVAGIYGVDFRRTGDYARLLAALGMDENHVWTEREKRSFSAGFYRFSEAFNKLKTPQMHVTPAEALLVWLKVFSFQEMKESSLTQIRKKLQTIWGDVVALDKDAPLEVSSAPSEKVGKSASLFNLFRSDPIQAAFIYEYSPEESAWTAAHEEGRKNLLSALGSRVHAEVYLAKDKNYRAAMEQAIANGAELLFATTPKMMSSCRRIASEHKNIKVLNCALAPPYTGVRTYSTRIYECKFIAGAIAGAMAEENLIGYVGSYPIMGETASINAFALGARMTNPRAKILLRWSCLPGNPVKDLWEEGASVISGRDAGGEDLASWNGDFGLYRLSESGEMTPLALPKWNWGEFYREIVESVGNGSYASFEGTTSYRWGLNSKVIGLTLYETLPEGVKNLASFLLEGVSSGIISPFRTKILDSDGKERNSGERDFSADEIMNMDFLCENVEGHIPEFEELKEESSELVRLVGLRRKQIAPKKEEGQL